MVWSWTAEDNRTWPSSFGTAAWCGNGLHGLSPLVDRATASLRFEVARTDVWSCGYAPRLPIGFLRLWTAGAMISGRMRQSLANGTVTGTVVTAKGEVRFRAFTSATRPVSVVELQASAGEHSATLALVAEPAAARVNGLLDAPRMINPPPRCRESDRVSVCEQPLACDSSGRSGYATALLRTADNESGSSVYFISVGNSQPTAQMYPDVAAITAQNRAQAPPVHRKSSSPNPHLTPDPHLIIILAQPSPNPYLVLA
jgi:hypothetical protein